QVHTTTTGIGPVYMVGGAGGVSPIGAANVPGGVYDKWVNLKVEINAPTIASRYWINNCLVPGAKGSGVRGDGNLYFKMGVYHCDTGMCRDRYKNVHPYMKPQPRRQSGTAPAGHAHVGQHEIDATGLGPGDRLGVVRIAGLQRRIAEPPQETHHRGAQGEIVLRHQDHLADADAGRDHLPGFWI